MKEGSKRGGKELQKSQRTINSFNKSLSINNTNK